MSEGDFRKWLQGVWEDDFHRVKKHFAHAIGISPTHIGRVLKTGELGPESVLRLAALKGTDASALLRMAGHHELPALIERCYPSPRPVAPEIAELTRLLMQPELAFLAKVFVQNARETRAALQSQSPGGKSHPPASGTDPESADTPRETPLPKRRASR